MGHMSINESLADRKFIAPNGDICENFREAFDKFCFRRETCKHCDLRSADCLRMERLAYRYSYPEKTAQRLVNDFCRITGFRILEK